MKNIINIFKDKKSIPLDQFINIALYNKNFGYYMKKNPFGKKGDFITSPLISNIFSEMLAIWCVAFWENLGKPKKILLVELGPGDGTLCYNLIKVFKQFDSFYDALEINLLEISKKLKKIQKIKIKNKKVKWIKKIEDINHGPVVFLSNEFFNSLPIKQVYKKKNIYLEKCITKEKNSHKIKFSCKKASSILIKKIKELDILYDSGTIEYPIDAVKYLTKISKKINKFNGSFLTFDYGYTEKNKFSTLQSVKKHRYINILEQPGNADITSHINFKLFSDIFKKEGLIVEKVITQNEFLKKMGIIERANIISKKMTFKEKTFMFLKLKKLLDHSEMGRLFKVLFAHRKNNNFSLGF